MRKATKISVVLIAALFLSACNIFGGGEKVPEIKRTNIALNKPVTASSVRNLPNLNPPQYFPPEFAVDGIWNTYENRWLTSVSGPHWLIIDLEDSFVVNGAEVWTGDATSGSTHAVAKYILQYWDEDEWIDIPGVFVENNEDEYVSFNIDPPVVTDQIRFWSDLSTTIIRVAEIAIYGDPVDNSGQ